MTVCVAAICTWNGSPAVVGASDRMLTADDIEYTPAQAKVYPLSKRIVAMVAGKIEPPSLICRDLVAEVERRSITSVKDVADLYAQKFSTLRRERAERKY